MKLDDEMRQACALALNVIPANLSPNHIAAFAAGYRMGLERAAKVCEDCGRGRVWTAASAGVVFAVRRECIDAIRALARDPGNGA